METPKKSCAWHIHVLSDALGELVSHLLDMHRPHNVFIACDVLDQETQDVHVHEENNITKIVIKICDFFGRV